MRCQHTRYDRHDIHIISNRETKRNNRTRVLSFFKTRLHSDNFWSRTACHSEYISAQMYYLCRLTRRFTCGTRFLEHKKSRTGGCRRILCFAFLTSSRVHSSNTSFDTAHSAFPFYSESIWNYAFLSILLPFMDCSVSCPSLFFFFEIIISFFHPNYEAGGFILDDLLDKPWSQVSEHLPSGTCLYFLSRIGLSLPTTRRFS